MPVKKVGKSAIYAMEKILQAKRKSITANTRPPLWQAPNAPGLYDMSGNVWEWTCSEYAKFFNGKEEKCSKNLIKNNTVRGGSWGSQQRGVRASNRNVIFGGYGPADADSHRGFRLARD